MGDKKSVLNMESSEARDFFLKPTSYFEQNMPPYFDFQYLLNVAVKKLGDKELKDKNHLCKDKKYSKYAIINYKLQMNKSINTYRPITLIHPYLYVDYVNYLTSNKVWSKIKERFSELHEIIDENITCSSIPFNMDESDSVIGSKESALNYWQTNEQESIKLNLEYNGLLKVDISNFYGSIYTHTICWAMHGESHSKSQKEEGNLRGLIGDKLDTKFQYMNYGETVSIPQGNVLSDFIAELLLAYIDSLLVKKLSELDNKLDYKILRYRDDYRIFTNNTLDSEKIKRELGIILERVKLSLGESKTIFCTDVISGAIKEDKIFWIEHDPVIKITTDKFYKDLNECYAKDRESNIANRIYSVTLQKHLLTIKLFSDKFPNSGQLRGALLEFEKRINNLNLNYEDFEYLGTEVEVLIAILIDILKKNPKITDVGVKILSNLLQKISYGSDSDRTLTPFFSSNDISNNKEDYEIRIGLINSINHQLTLHNNNDYLEIWLQRLVVKNLNQDSKFIDEYKNKCQNNLIKLCNSVISEEEIDNKLFNEEWLEEKHRIDLKNFINKKAIENLSDIMLDSEIYLAEYDGD